MPNSQAHLQFAQSKTRPKIAKELCCCQRLFCQPEKQNRDSAKIENASSSMKGIENPAGNTC